MNQRLLHLNFPAPLLPLYGTVQSIQDIVEKITSYVPAPEADRVATRLWDGEQQIDSHIQTTIICLTLTGNVTTCPHCQRAVPEVLASQKVQAWCGCQGEP